MGQPEFGAGIGIAAGSGGDLEDAHGVERRGTTHSTREKIR
jgi:hypothetical protein